MVDSKHLIQRRYDPDAFDLGVVNNNLHLRFTWQRATSDLGECRAAWIAALDGMARLWWPDRLVLTLAPLLDVLPQQYEEHREIDLPAVPDGALGAHVATAVDRFVSGELAGAPGPGWGLAGLDSDIFGWCRLAIPPGADTASLSIASTDSVGPQPHRLVPAPPIQDFETRWLRLSEVSAESHVSLTIASPSQIQADLKLGVDLLADGDARSPDRLVLGVPRQRWRQANHAMLDAVVHGLKTLGWDGRVAGR